MAGAVSFSLTALEPVINARALAEVHSGTAAVLARLGFDSFVAGLRMTAPNGTPVQFVVSAYPPDWQRRYAEAGYVEVDPTVTHALTRTTPLVWSDSVFARNRPAQAFWEEAQSFGLKSGVSIPVHGPGGEASMLSVSLDAKSIDAERQVEAIVPVLPAVAAFIHEALDRVAREQLAHTLACPQLSQRETEVLSWVASGKSNWDIAQILGVSEDAIRFHLRNVFKKLDVHSRGQAVARALTLGLITP